MDDLFKEPTGFPLFREGVDHKITLEMGANPVNLRPYRYSTLQKDFVDIIIQEMLIEGVIQCSFSPYASPVVLVKKKDGTQRLCVDCRRLNKQALKDNYHILFLKNLVDKLGGYRYLSKLDLRVRFDQLRMSPEDMYKTTFKTHPWHYEYLVIPFNLTNTVFHVVAMKFLLVFFDDILVYNSYWEYHLQHLREVFSILRQQQLYLKPLKYTFGATTIEYWSLHL